MTTPSEIHDSSTYMLSSGTQTIEMRAIFNAHCRCGKSLFWIYTPDEEQNPSAECTCGMYYYAWPTTVKSEGVDRSEQWRL